MAGVESVLVGQWRDPAAPDNEVAGELHLEASGLARLDLEGRLPSQNPTMLCGRTKTGSDVTLTDLQNYPINVVYARTALLGHAFQKASQLNFYQLDLFFRGLEDWVRSTGFRRVAGPKRAGRKIEIVYKRPLFPVHKFGNKTIDIQFEVHRDSEVFRSVAVREKPYVRIKSQRPMSLDEVRQLAWRIQGFFTLGMGDPSYMETVRVWNRRYMFHEYPDRTRVPKPATLHLPQFEESSSRLHPALALFTFSDLPLPFGQHIEAWLHLYDRAKAALDLFTSTAIRPVGFIELEFVSLAQALESFHREVVGGEYENPEVFKAIRKTIMGAIPATVSKDLRKSIVDRLGWAYEYELRTRIDELLQLAQPIAPQFFPKEYARDFVRNRNGLAHAGQRAASVPDLRALCDRTRLLLSIAFLLQIGFPAPSLKALLERTYRWNSIKI